MREKFNKIFTALVTPFENGQIDFKSLGKLLEFQQKNGITGFVINGTTAESPTLEIEEVERLFKFIKNNTSSGTTLVVGSGTNSTSTTLKLTMMGRDWGADAALVVVPYYNKPPQRGLVSHFTKVARETNFPIILYNVPGRTITSLSIESIVELSKVPNIIGIKEATGNIEFAKEIRMKCGSDFLLLSGDDPSFLDFVKAGGDGTISVASHILPKLFVEVLQKPNEKAEAFNSKKKIMEELFVEANPIPVKKALQFMGILNSAELRLPLVEMERGLAQSMKAELSKSGILL